VNYEDPYHVVGLPVFAIHGNHDDPAREGGDSKPLSALDLLSTSNLVNYIGKAEQVDDIEITPVLLRKGDTHIALYALGAIRDERLNRMWTQKNVKFVRPTEQQGKEKFFNIFVLHQNRDYGRGSKNCIHEKMIPEWMDVVVWGNEHECHPNLEESLVGTYRIYQPGSSVCTSLNASESMQNPKSLGMLEIKGKKFRLRTTPYTQVRRAPLLSLSLSALSLTSFCCQVRPFVYADLCLSDVNGLDAADPRIEEKIKTVLTDKVHAMAITSPWLSPSPLPHLSLTSPSPLSPQVHAMIAEARERGTAAVADAYPHRLTYRAKQPRQVLVRLRVDHYGYPSLNQQRFGSQFVGEIANPSDVIAFTKKKKDGPLLAGAAGPAAAPHAPRAPRDDPEEPRVHVEGLVKTSLFNNPKQLQILIPEDFEEALEDYVLRRDNAALERVLEGKLDHVRKVGSPTSLRHPPRSPRNALSLTHAVVQNAGRNWRWGMGTKTSPKRRCGCARWRRCPI